MTEKLDESITDKKDFIAPVTGYEYSEQAEGAETEYKREALALLERLGETEKAFQKAREIVNGLDKDENRQIFSDCVNDFHRLQGSAEPDDFDGSYPLDIKNRELQEHYGVCFFPLTVAVPVEKWSPYYTYDSEGSPLAVSAEDYQKYLDGSLTKIENPFYPNRDIDNKDIKLGRGVVKLTNLYNKERGHSVMGFMLPSKENTSEVNPFLTTGLSFISEEVLKSTGSSSHEELHRVFDLYSPFSEQLKKDLEDNAYMLTEPELYERYASYYVLSEINSYRSSVSSGDTGWLEAKGNRASVSDTLKKQFKSFDKIDPKKIKKACRAVEYLSQDLSLNEAAITHILLNSETLDGLIAWLNVRPIDIKPSDGREESWITKQLLD